MSNGAAKQSSLWLCFLPSPLILLTIDLFRPADFTSRAGRYEYLLPSEHHTHDEQFTRIIMAHDADGTADSFRRRGHFKRVEAKRERQDSPANTCGSDVQETVPHSERRV